MPKAFYLLLFISCMVWMGNTVWGTYGKVWFTDSVFLGDQEAADGTIQKEAYKEGAQAFGTAGQIGSVFNLGVALSIMGLGMTSIPSYIIYAPCIMVGAVVCFLCAFVVEQNQNLALLCFVLSNIPLTAAGSIPYGIVAVWNKAAVQAGHVGSVAMQMAILNCCITVGQQLCTMILGGFEGRYDVNESLKDLFIISTIAGGVAGVCALFLKGSSPEVVSSAEGSESEGTSDAEGSS
jgi:hypothetical protein